MSRGRFARPALLRALAAVAFLAIWTAATYIGRLPNLYAVATGIGEMISKGTYFHDIAISVLRFLAGWGLGAVLGIPLGLLTGREQRFIGPILEINFHAERAVPVIALVPLAVYWWGIGEASKIFLVTWGSFFPIWVNTHNGARSFNQNYVNAARSLGTEGRALWWRVYLPHVSEAVLSGMRISIGVALICVVAAELTGSLETGFFSRGLGYRIQRAADINRLDLLLGCIFTFGFLGWAADLAFSAWARPLILLIAKFDPQRSTLRAQSSATR
jgi:ABC-type nitrate/sulfonate/bicarbonate transport system permease component